MDYSEETLFIKVPVADCQSFIEEVCRFGYKTWSFSCLKQIGTKHDLFEGHKFIFIRVMRKTLYGNVYDESIDSISPDEFRAELVRRSMQCHQ